MEQHSNGSSSAERPLAHLMVLLHISASILNCGASLLCLLRCQPGSVQWKQEVFPWLRLQALFKASQCLGKLLLLLLKGQPHLRQPWHRVC